MIYAILLIAAYLLGSIPFGWLMVWLAGKGDIRKVGTSGGTGATNVARVIGMKGFIATWVLDMAKAIAVVLLGAHFVSLAFGALCGFVAIAGHNFPIWLKFKGGKGFAPQIGVLVAVNPIVFVVIGIEWLLVAITTRYSSLAAIVGILVAPVLGFAMDFNIGLVFVAIALMNLYQHRENIQRLLRGTESKIQMNIKKLAVSLILIGLLALGLIIAFNV